MSSVYDKVHIATDGVPFSMSSGLRRTNGYAYSANLLTPARNLGGIQFVLGPPRPARLSVTGRGEPCRRGCSATSGSGDRTIGGPPDLLALDVGYADGSTKLLIQDFSDWTFPQDYDGEIEAVAMPYRTLGDGTLDRHNIQNLYAYRFPLDDSKAVASLTLPQDSNVILHAVTLTGPVAPKDGGVEIEADGGNLPDTDAGQQHTPPELWLRGWSGRCELAGPRAAHGVRLRWRRLAAIDRSDLSRWRQRLCRRRGTGSVRNC